MTEDGAESIGVVMDTAGTNSATEDSFWEPIPEEERTASNGDAETGEQENAETAENAAGASDVAVDNTDAQATDEAEAANEAVGSDEVVVSDNSEETDATDADSSEIISSDDETLENSQEANPNTDGTLSTIPESVNLADYVTKTIFERMVPDSEDEWEEISEEDINEGDIVRITLVYKLPKEAKASDDIYFDIPEEYGIVDLEKTALENGTGEYETTEDNKVKISYNEDVKEEIKNEVEENNQNDDYSSLRRLESFFIANKAAISSLLYMKAYAADNEYEERVILYATRGSSDENSRVVIDKVQVQKYENGNWVDVGSDDSGEEHTQVEEVSIANGDTLRFFMDYTVPRGTLDYSTEEGRTIEGYIPKTVRPLEEEYGKVKNSSGMDVGDYKLGTDGKLTVVFDELFAKQNETHAIKSSFYFDGLFSTDKEEGNAEFKFSDNVNILVPIKKVEEKHDLSLEKTAEKKDGRVVYKIVISSMNGTDGDISLSDKMKIKLVEKNGNETEKADQLNQIRNGKVESLKLIRKDGSESTLNTGINDFKDFNITLPKLNAGEKYILTYSVEYKPAEHVKLINSATTEAGKDKKSQEYTVEFNPYPTLSKYGSFDYYNDKIIWVIEVNSNGNDLSGYKVVDKYIDPKNGNEKEYHGKAILTKPNGSTVEVNLPYTFTKENYSSENEKYRFEYSIDPKEWRERAQTTATNKVVISKGPETVAESEATVTIPGEGELVKEAQSGEIKDDVIEITWNVTIHGKISNTHEPGQKPGWTYNDELSDGYFTEQQINELKEVVKNIHDFGKKAEVTPVKKDGLITGFSIRFDKELPKDKSISFTYKSSYKITDKNSAVSILNKGTVKDKSVEGKYDYTPYVEKYDYDAVAAGKDLSEAKKPQEVKEYSDIDGILSWGFLVNIPSDAPDGEFKLVETLPGSVKLLERSEGVTGLAVSEDKNVLGHSPRIFDLTSTNKTAEVTYNNTKIKATVADGEDNNDVVTINIPCNSNLKGKTLYFAIKGQIDPNYQWKGIDSEGNPTVERFDNQITLYDSNNSELGGDSYYEEVIRKNEIIKKTANGPEEGIVSYKVEINKYAEDLLEEKDELTFTDVLRLKYYTYDKKEIYANATLVPGSFKVTRINDDGTATVLEHGVEYSYTTDSRLEEKSSGSDGYYHNYERTNTITMPIKDKQHLIVEYQYLFKGTEGLDITAENIATLDGFSDVSSSDKRQFQIQKSHMSADIDGINLYKVDKLNEDIRLEGAEFDLYKYDGTDYKLLYHFITDKDGYYPLDQLESGYAYKLVETKAPDLPETETDDYYILDEPYYFTLVDLNATTGSVGKIPDDFHGEELFKGETIFIKDLPKNIEISVEKEWGYIVDDEFVKESNPNRTAIDVTLYKQLSSVPIETVNCDVVYTDHYLQQTKAQQKGVPQYLTIQKGGKLQFEFTLGKNQVQYVTGFNLYDSNQKYADSAIIEKIYEERNGKLLDQIVVKAEGETFEPEKSKISYDAATYTATLVYYVPINRDLNVTTMGDYYSGVTINGPVIISGETDAVNTQEQVVETITLTPSCDWKHTWKSLPRYYESSDGLLYCIDYYVREGKPEENISENSRVFDYKLYGISYDHQPRKIAITVQNELVPTVSLPSTGSTGTSPFTFGGIALLVTSFIGFSLNNQRRKREEE